MYKIVTIERQYATGGNEIGRRLAERLNFAMYNQTILVEAAKRLEIPPIYIGELEETSPGSVIFNLSQTSLGGKKAPTKKAPLADRLFYEEANIIRESVEKGACIIVGRCGNYILNDRTDCLKVFIYADTAFRIKRAIEAEHIDATEAESTLKKVDKRRSSFYERHTSLDWRDGAQYDLRLNSGSLGIDACVDILAAAVTRA